MHVIILNSIWWAVPLKGVKKRFTDNCMVSRTNQKRPDGWEAFYKFQYSLKSLKCSFEVFFLQFIDK